MRQLTVNCSITVVGHRALIRGVFPLSVVRMATSYFEIGYRFSPAYKRWVWDPLTRTRQRAWDGRCHLFDAKTNTMPAGLVSIVAEALRNVDTGARVMVVRDDVAPAAADAPDWAQLCGIEFGVGRYDYQLLAAEAALKHKQCILKMSTNSGKTAVATAIAKRLRLPTLFMVPGVDLLYQARRMFADRLGMSIDDIGVIGDSKHHYGDWITVATVDTLHARLNDDPEFARILRSKWSLLFIDECHTSGSDTYYEVLDACDAHYRIGLSGTPLDRSDGADLRLIAQTGEVAYEVSNKLLIERGVSVPVSIELKRIEAPVCKATHWKTVQREAVINNETLNTDVVDWTVSRVEDGLQVVVLVKEIEHGKVLEEAIRTRVGAGVKFLNGQEESSTRADGLQAFTAGTIRCLIGTSILYQGIDTPAIDALVFADLGKSRIVVLQALGRGLRARPGKERLLVRDYANFCHKWLTEHSLARIKTYKREGCFTLLVG